MSRSSPTELEELVLLIQCDQCGAQPGYWCRTKSGRPATWLHSHRDYPVRTAWGVGYERGHESAREAVAKP